MHQAARQRRLWLVGLLLLAPAAAQEVEAPAGDPPGFKVYSTPYYVIHTDLAGDLVGEASIRLTVMAEEYHRRTQGLSGTIRRRLPVYLFSDPGMYLAAGGVAGSAGQYDGRRLMAIISPDRPERSWATLQHEGFHQFAHMVIRGDLPVWVNEGLAEYFGQGIWTGDNFVTGLVPPQRLQRIKRYIQDDQIVPFLQMLTMSHPQWRGRLSGRNYDQAWSMVHFMVNADNDLRRTAMETFVNNISHGAPWERSFLQSFGRDVRGLEKHYKDWWLALGDDPTADLHTLAVVQTLTSFLARAHSQGQQFDDAEAFLRAGQSGGLKLPADQWLPPALLAGAVRKAQALGAWSLDVAGPRPKLVLRGADGKTFTGTFSLENGRAANVQVLVKEAPPGPAGRPAQSQPAGK